MVSFRDLSERAAQDVLAELGVEPSAEDRKKLVAAIERAVIEAVRIHHEQCVHAVQDCCPQDRDLAHKIAKRMEQEQTAVIANLGSLR